MGARRRLLMITVAAGCATGMLAACADTVDGAGSVARRAPSSGPSGAPTGNGSPTGFPSSSASTPGSQGALSSYLVKAPADSEHGSSTWASTTSPTVRQFVEHFYDTDQVTAELARLQTDGINGVAHNLWIRRGVQADVILLQFQTPTGALTRHSGIVSATRSDSTLRSASPSLPGDVTEFYASKVDKLGNIASRAYAIKGDITMEIFLFSPKTFDEKDLTAVAGAQVARLP